MFRGQKKYWLAFLVFGVAGIIYSTAVFATQLDRDSYGTIHENSASTNFQINNQIADPAAGRVTSSNYILEHYYILGTTTVFNHCSNSILDYDEVQIDCGGGMCQSCVFHCSNSVKDYDETGVDCGGAFCVACGGGGGGTILNPQVSFSGLAIPGGTVSVQKDGILAGTVTADALGNFLITLNNLSAGNYRFSLYCDDTSGRRSAPYYHSAQLRQGISISVANIFLSPTLSLDRLEAKQGDPVRASGQTLPFADVAISLIEKSTGKEIFFHTRADQNGFYGYTIGTAALAYGGYSVKVKATQGALTSGYSNAEGFLVGLVTIEKPSGQCPAKGDLNDDCRVNLIDFSIAAFWHGRAVSHDFSILENAKLSGDKKVNLVDFSIMAYYWTG